MHIKSKYIAVKLTNSCARIKYVFNFVYDTTYTIVLSDAQTTSDTYFLTLNICLDNLNFVFIKCEDRHFSRDEWFKEFTPCKDIFIIFC